jgi:predicted ATPase
MIHLRLEGQAHPTYYEIGLDHTIVSTALYEPHYPHITAFRMELENWQVFYLEPKTLMREEVPLAEVKRIGPRGENLAAFLNTLKHQEEKAFDNFGLTLQAVLPSATKVEVELLKEGRLSLRLSENGISYSARLISEGTLRILGLLAALHPRSPATLIGYEEPENGVHPVRLETIANLLKNAATQFGKQVIVTSHSPIFPTYFKDDNLFVCSKDGPYTTIKPFKTFGSLFRPRDIEHALEDRILRGDFGG